MRVVVINDLSDLAGDMAAIPVEFNARAGSVVRRYANEGNREAKRIAQAKAGPHGKAYYKRLTAELTGPLTAEYGPEGEPKTNFVGVGFRHGRNTDLPQSADLIAPRFADGVLTMADGLFW